MVAKSIAKMYTNIHKPTDYWHFCLHTDRRSTRIQLVLIRANECNSP